MALGARGPQSESCSLPLYAEPLAEQAQSGLVVATEVVEPVAPSPSPGADNLSGGQTSPEVAAAQAASELLVKDSFGGGDALQRPPSRLCPTTTGQGT